VREGRGGAIIVVKPNELKVKEMNRQLSSRE
jgi:hypothetical protein